jgi:Protein of unknown function (DUF3037)
MPENHLFEYAVIRIVPRVEREEFLNVGVILYCSGLQFLASRFTLNEDRLHAFCEHTDLHEVREHLRAFELIARGSADGGPIAKLPVAERFRWLTATRSTIVQASKVHPGLCTDADQTLTRLHEQLVL